MNNAATHSNMEANQLSIENIKSATNQLKEIIQRDIPIRIRVSINYSDWRAIYGKNSIED